MNTKKTIYFLYFFLYVTEAFEFDSFTSLFDTRIDVEGAIERFLNAVDEYYEAGGIEAVKRGMLIDEGTVFVPRTRVFGLEEALSSPYPVTCFRIPAAVQTDTGAILAFAEARMHTCSDCAELGIAMRRSDDGGLTWGDIIWPVPPTPTGEGYEMTRGGNPTVAFDSKRKQVVLHFNRGLTDPDGDGNYDCIPAVDNFQIISQDDGFTWGTIKNISSFLGSHRGFLPGPGNGAYLPEIDRLIFAGHYSTAERPDGRVVIYFSDDGGETYTISESIFPAADESSVVFTGGSNLTVSMRKDVNQCDICPPKANACNCRGRSFSTDYGETWSEMELDPQLRDPICEGSIAKIGDYTAFSNPPMSYARSNLSIALSSDGGHMWDYRVKITDEYQYTDYSSLVDGELIVNDDSNYPVAGLLWGSCLHPIPMRVWCLFPTSWEIYFSRIELDPATFVPA